MLDLHTTCREDKRQPNGCLHIAYVIGNCWTTNDCLHVTYVKKNDETANDVVEWKHKKIAAL